MNHKTKASHFLESFCFGVLQNFRQRFSISNRVDLIACVFGVLSIVLRWYKPILPLYQAMHDDALFVRYASNIINGKWLGEYALQGNLTLAKPPGFAIFLAFAHFVPLPFVVIIQIVVVTSAISVMRSIRFFGLNKEVALFGYLITIFLPTWFGKASSRVYRDAYLAALVITLIALTLLVVRIYERKLGRATTIQLTTAVIFLGLVISMLRITKNIEVASYAFVCICLISVILKDFKFAFKRWKHILIGLFLLLVSVESLNFTVKQLNQSHYGVSLTNNYTNGEFANALMLMTSVKDENQQSYVPLTKSMRFSIYEVSPTFRQLKPHLELPDGTGWRGQACNSPLRICNETALWFTWDLRDAVVLAGLSNNAIEFENFFRKVSSEISVGCEKKVIACGSHGLAPGIGPFSEMSPRHIVESLSGTASQIFGLAGAGGESALFDSTVKQKDVQEWNSVVNGVPANRPLNSFAPGINSGSETYELMINLFRPIWQLFISLGIVGLFIFILRGSYRRDKILMGLLFGGLAGASTLCLQLAILDSEMGLFVKTGTAYYLPIYPFVTLILTIGLNAVVEFFRN
jgi:hypothetical protein